MTLIHAFLQGTLEPAATAQALDTRNLKEDSQELVLALRNRVSREKAIELLRYLGPGFARSVMPLLRSSDKVLRQAIEMYILLHAHDIANTLLEFAMLRNQDRIVANRCVRLLGQMPPKESIYTLVRALGHHDLDVVCTALSQLAKKGDRSVGPALASKFEAWDWEIRKAAVRAVRILSVSELEVDVQLMLEDDFWPVRQEAARALGIIGTSTSVPHLASRLHDEDPKLRTISKASLIQVTIRHGPLDSLPLLQAHCASKDAYSIIIKAIECSSDAIVPLIQELAQETEVDAVVAQLVISALAEVEDSGILSVLSMFLSHGNLAVREHALEEIAEMPLAWLDDLVYDLADSDPLTWQQALTIVESVDIRKFLSGIQWLGIKSEDFLLPLDLTLNIRRQSKSW